MNIFVWCPASCRRNDLYMLNESHFKDKMELLQQDWVVKLGSYGDSAYIVASDDCVLAKHAHPNQRQDEVNSKMSTVHDVIEWDNKD